MSQQTVAQAVVSQLAAWQIKYIFGVCGGGILPVLDAITHSEIKFIAAASEAGAAFMASYHAKLTGARVFAWPAPPGQLICWRVLQMPARMGPLCWP